jgi:hypothetical protein
MSAFRPRQMHREDSKVEKLRQPGQRQEKTYE